MGFWGSNTYSDKSLVLLLGEGQRTLDSQIDTLELFSLFCLLNKEPFCLTHLLEKISMATQRKSILVLFNNFVSFSLHP